MIWVFIWVDKATTEHMELIEWKEGSLKPDDWLYWDGGLFMEGDLGAVSISVQQYISGV